MLGGLRHDPDAERLLDLLPLGVLVLRARAIVYANPTARAWLHLSDVTPADLPAADWADLLADDVKQTRRLSTTGEPAAAAGDQPRSRTVTFASARTLRWWVDAAWRLRRCRLTDVTGEQRAQRASRTLVSDLGHELRTPIATVLTHLEILGFGDVGEDVHAQSLHLAKREAQRMSRLVSDILELGRLETVETLPLRALDLATLAEESVFQTMPGARERDISLHTVSVSGLPLVLGNADRLRQVLLNLLDNGVKYSAPGAEVTVSLSRAAEGVACEVCDTGPGIASEHLPYVMQRFYRAAPESTEGSGLGLSLVQEVLRHHGSELVLSSPGAEGRGTCARFVLPVAGDAMGDRAMSVRRSLTRLPVSPLWLGLICLVVAGYWLLPIAGRVIVVRDGVPSDLWPTMRLPSEPQAARTVATVKVSDATPWSFVTLWVDGIQAIEQGPATVEAGIWTWTWTYSVPSTAGYTITFYRDCHTGCIERGRWAIGAPADAGAAGIPTKLGLVMPQPDRDWHGRSGWAVEITYARRAEDAYWGVDDLAERVALHHAKGLRVLVRVDFEQQQTLPRPGNYVELTEYLAYMRRLARDGRFDDVYGYIVGSDVNTTDAMAAAPGALVSPAWYARVLNGYGEEPTNAMNAVEVIRSEQPEARVIAGPLRPWVEDQGGANEGIAPWLGYMDDLVRRVDEATTQKARAGVALTGPDGFDVQAPGRPDAPTMAGKPRSDEPRIDLFSDEWGGAQAGFRVYQDWLAIINTYPTTRGLPVYIISTNTYDREASIPPAQNYPSGWLTTALEVANAEPQIAALVWFLDDFPHSDEWDLFSLTEQPGRLVDAAREFDVLLMME